MNGCSSHILLIVNLMGKRTVNGPLLKRSSTLHIQNAAIGVDVKKISLGLI